METWQVIANIRLEGRINTQFRETAINEAESIINGNLKDIHWLNNVERLITATRRIYP